MTTLLKQHRNLMIA